MARRFPVGSWRTTATGFKTPGGSRTNASQLNWYFYTYRSFTGWRKQKKKKKDEWEQMRRSEMSWSTHVNSHFLIQKNTKRTTYISTFISNIHRLKTPACSDIFSRGNIYRLYHKINLYCLFHADGWLGGLWGPIILFSEHRAISTKNCMWKRARTLQKGSAWG